METLITYSNPPIDINDMQAIQDLLRHEDIFRTALPTIEFDPYNVFDFLLQKDRHETDVCVILDRNVFSYVIGLARGTDAEPMDGKPIGPRRLAAAIMAHLQCANALIEPGVALHEYAFSKDGQEAANERDLFWRADNLDPRIYADIALGRRSQISAAELEELNLPPPTRNTDFSEKPPIWECSYLLALRLALFELQDGTQAEKFKRFLGWMHLDFIWSAAATQFASLYFSSQRCTGMLKRVRSNDRAF